MKNGYEETLPAAGSPGCPEVAALLAAAADPHGAPGLGHLDACAACRRVVAAARAAAPEDDVGCDGVETLLAELDDGRSLTAAEHARIFVHFVGCDACRAGVEPLDTATPALRGDAPPSRLPIVARGAYVVEQELARGGMGRILRAVDQRLGRTVAVKEVLPQAGRPFAEVRLANARLEREARITARLNHPSIVSVHEAGTWPQGSPFIAMDLVAGRSLDRVIADARDLDARLALLPHVIAVADALAYAHHEGVVHRDLKPANVLVGKFGETVVIDWGLAKLVGEPDDDGAAPRAPDAPPALTQHGAAVGTPAYMPPEQAAGDAVDRRADVYALGAMLYHLLAGKPPHHGTHPRELLEVVRRRPPAPLGELAPRVPPALATIVARAMARAPDARYPSAAEFAEELRRFQTGRLVRAHSYGALDLARHWLRHRRVSVTLAVGLAAALLVTGGVGLTRVLHERDRAQRESERLTAARARGLVARDPTAAMAWLARLAISERNFREAHAVAAEAEAAGVARRVLAGHAAMVYFVTTSVDGRLAVSGDADGELRLWDLVAGSVRRLGAHGGAVYELSLSPDARRLAVAGEGGLDLWELATTVPRPLHGHRGAVLTVGFTADGRELVSGGQDGTVRRWRVDGGAPRVLLGVDDPAATPAGPLRSVLSTEAGARHVLSYHAARAGHTAVLTAGGEAVLLDAAGHERWRVPHPAGMPPYAALAPAGDELTTVGQDGELRRFDLASGAWRALARRPDVVRIEYSPDGRWLAASSREHDVRLFDLRGGGAERTLAGHTLQIYRVAFSRDGALLASASHDGTVRVWDPEQGELWTLRGHRGAVQWLAFGAAGALLSLSVDGTARLWSPPARATRILARHAGAAYGVRFSADGRVVASNGLDGHVRVTTLATHGEVDLAHSGGVWRAWIAPRGDRAVTTDAAATCRLWDVSAATAVVLGDRAACHERAAFDPTGERVATLGRDLVLRLWSVADPATPRRSARDVLAFAFAGRDVVYLTAAGDVVREERVVAHVPPPYKAAWSADGATLAVADRAAITVLELASGRRTVVPRPDAPFSELHVSPDGRRLAIGDLMGRLHVFDSATGAARVFAGHSQGVVAVALAPGGRFVASASQGELLLWDLDSGQPQRLHGHAQWVNGLAFSPDGTQLLSAGTDGTVRLWSAELATAAPTSPAAVAAEIARATHARLDERDELVVQRD